MRFIFALLIAISATLTPSIDNANAQTVINPGVTCPQTEAEVAARIGDTASHWVRDYRVSAQGSAQVGMPRTANTVLFRHDNHVAPLKLVSFNEVLYVGQTQYTFQNFLVISTNPFSLSLAPKDIGVATYECTPFDPGSFPIPTPTVVLTINPQMQTQITTPTPWGIDDRQQTVDPRKKVSTVTPTPEAPVPLATVTPIRRGGSLYLIEPPRLTPTSVLLNEAPRAPTPAPERSTSRPSN